MENKIACVIVTYNRKQLLRRCLNAVESQHLKPSVVYIIDNASTDGTLNAVQEWGFFDCFRGGINYKYIKNKKNEGGAGGFYLGMKTVYESHEYVAVWCMDDDGAPDPSCLERLLPYLENYGYISPLVLSDEDHNSMAFTEKHEAYDVFLAHMEVENGIIHNYSMPFNGVLYSMELLQQVGYPKKEMFIWGDELNYKYRAYRKGFTDITVTDAIHYHPFNKITYGDYKSLRFVDIDSDWKLYCYLRNNWYNRIYVVKGFSVISMYQCLKEACLYLEFYREVKGQSKFCLIADAFFSAVIGRFWGLKHYISV